MGGTLVSVVVSTPTSCTPLPPPQQVKVQPRVFELLEEARIPCISVGREVLVSTKYAFFMGQLLSLSVNSGSVEKAGKIL